MADPLRTAATGLSLGRALLGAALLVAPEQIAERWVGPRGREAPAAALARSVGVRDVVLGAGAAVTLLRGDDSAPVWLAGSAACDLGDMVAMLVGRESLPESGVRGTLALAGASALLAGIAAARA